MKLFDSHCHLDDTYLNEHLESVLYRAHQSGVHEIMTVGIDKNSSVQGVNIAESREGIFASVGVHPHNARNCSEDIITVLMTLAQSSRVRAWGEIGLDFNRMYSPRSDQERWFFRQIHAADEVKLPLIFHERDTRGRFLDILTTHFHEDCRGVVHCFSGNRVELKAYLNLGLYIGITGVITIQTRGAELRDLVRYIPLERLLIETDAPFLTPAPEKNKTRRNEPAFVKSVLLKLAQVKNEDPDRLAEITTENAHRLFNI